MKHTGSNSVIQTYLDAADLKRTKGRTAVLNVLLAAGKPLPIEDIQKKVGERVHLVTLYRMLKQFVEKGIVYQTDLRRGKTLYELQHTHHHHIVCMICGLEEEITPCDTFSIQKEAERRSRQFAKINNHTLEFFGICKGCTQQQG